MNKIMTGKDKKMNFPIVRNIRLNELQNDKWNPKQIREFLDGKTDNNVMKDLKRLYQIMNVFLLPKINENKIAEIPNSVLEELENLEEGYDFE